MTADKYDILLCAFIASIMVQTGCSREEAVRRVATLCALTSEQFAMAKGAKHGVED